MKDIPHLLAKMLKEVQVKLEEATDLTMLDAVRNQYLGKKNGRLVALLKEMRRYTPEQRQTINQAKSQMLQAIADKRTQLEDQALQHKLKQQAIDVSLPGRACQVGGWHLVTQQISRLIEILTALGFNIVDGIEIEQEYYNFTALNMPAHHPARTMHDTFYLDSADRLLLRTHTSTVQIRFMEHHQPPLRIATLGRVYRRDFDPTHTPMFHQLEGLWIDERVTFADLKGLLQALLQSFFDSDSLTLRFRPTYFPFTEPSAEVDMQCRQCQGQGCRLCGHSGWIELLGCGMVHPNVLTEMKVDTEKYTGLAFGIGIDRLALLRHGIDDLRRLFENDWRFLGQFA